MHCPAHLTREEERRLDRLEDAGLALAALRKAIARGDRISIETFCWAFLRRLAAAPLVEDDAEEIRATMGLLEARIEFGVHERLRRFLLPLVTAVELQLEEAEKDVLSTRAGRREGGGLAAIGKTVRSPAFRRKSGGISASRRDYELRPPASRLSVNLEV